jgi:hypothetical protein
MAKQHKLFRQAQKFAVTVPAFAGLAMASGQQQDASFICLFAGSAEKYAFKLFLNLVPTAWQAIQGCAFDGHWSAISAIGFLVSTWHVLRTIIGAA